MQHLSIDGQHFYNMMVNASNKLEEKKEYVNSLNVFPVPDGDTGTNMSMTFKSAVNEIQNLNGADIGKIARILAKGALMGARGNSGVILSQILRGLSKGLEGKVEITAKELAEGIMEGSKSAYKAVMRPTEGTILTVIRAAGEAAIRSTETDITKLMEEVCSHSEDVLAKTPEMLPVLKQAKVVDAGGAGLLVIFKGMLEVLKDDIEFVEIINETVKENKASVQKTLSTEDIKYGYCTEFFILSEKVNIDKFKEELEPLGDSMIVVGGEGLVKVHIHTNDPGLILSKAVSLGELSKIKIDNMREQHRHILEDDYKEDNNEMEEENLPNKQYGFVSVSLGEGIKNIFEDLGIDVVIEGGQTMNPSTEDILNAINEIKADNIFILPNNKNIIMAATQAAELAEKSVHVIPTKTIPQGITAITSFNADATVEDNIEAMNTSIENVASGSITYAVRDTEIDDKVIKEGNIIGLREGKIEEIGDDKFEVCKNLIEKMVNENSELITIFYGEDCDKAQVETFVNELEDKYSDIDIQYYEGNQPLYYFIFSVE
ncbi:DAK2 domain-containing protein [Clostridium sp. HMP27]|uniref:DAK2 domain-containing protein n=1 Tax=Clostridium sp. HMP27 TaxID=1487921 RepID=UPI00052B9CC4|nr:DAK2 domain-containing protein [Clostridium sp. HMP27]KGK88467.1 dihydroxyacetone kinase [Clostridium sp. HMP27]